MKLFINEKLFSLHKKFYVKDENNVEVYEISSKVFSLNEKTTISDMQGNKIVYVERQLFTILPNYDIYINDSTICRISRKFQLFKNDYELSNGYRVEGDFFMLNFNIYDNSNNLIGNIKKQLYTFYSDKYTIEIFDETQKEIILAIIVAIANDINRAQSANH